ncbi:hypothetical protein BCV72DRAFT_204236, partial [Rhizopus microsporus var. microsporus]
DDIKYAEKLEKEELTSIKEKSVLIDPNPCDLLFCMHENSIVKDKRLFRYTSNQRSLKTRSRKFKKLRQEMVV